MKRRIKSVLKYIPLCLAGLFFFVPFIWLISTSLKSSDQIFSYPPEWIPKPAKFSNYREAFEAIPYLKYILNTMKTTSLAVLGNVLSAPMIGYAFGKLKWPGRDKVFMLVVATMMLPFTVTMIPLYSLFSRLGWINTYIPLVLPDFLGTAYFIFLMRQFYRNLPDEFMEAARIDGASELWVYARIALPLEKPAVVTVALFSLSRKLRKSAKIVYNGLEIKNHITKERM
jgi:multiple sugar transport system permease protein